MGEANIFTVGDAPVRVPEGNLQRQLSSGAFDPYHSELGDGKMAMLAARELRTGKEVPIPQETPPTDAERVFALMKELIALLRPSDEMRDQRDQRDQPDWKFDKRKNRWVQVVPKVEPPAKKKAAKAKRKKRR
jgi:hypothetical protein